MKTYSTEQIRNIFLIGNSGSGKTTLAEAMAFNGGIIERRGDVNSKNTISDFKEIEQANENSIFSALLYTEYNHSKINILDTPGLDDFIGGVISSMQVADTGLMVLNAQNGVEVGAEIHNRHLSKVRKPMIIVVNHLDNEKAYWEKTIETAKERFGHHVTLIQFPVDPGSEFNALVDVLTMKMYKYSNDGGKAEISDIPANLMDQATALHNELIEKAAENDESLMELFFANDTLTEEEMRKGITLGLISRGIIPVFCISARKNIGVSRLLEFICNTVPSPADMTPSKAGGKEIKCEKSGQTSLFVFKSSYEPHVGEIVYFKVMSGEIKEAADLINTNTKNKERISQIFATTGKNRTRVPSMIAGDLGTTVKLKATKTNHTLASSADLK
ncbi:MAG TPA: GTP-binding protein, partial [Bacteroidales bacterium]|nr:GTP-binding protein [Bacteroidales bacterium]